MSITEQLESLEIDLKEINEIPAAHRVQYVDLLPPFGKRLSEILPSLCSPYELTRREQLVLDYRRIAAEVKGKLIEEVDRLILPYKQKLDLTKPDEITAVIRQARNQWRIASQLEDGGINIERLAETETQLEIIETQLSGAGQVLKLQAEVKALWESGWNLVKAGVNGEAVDKFKLARTLTQAAKQEQWSQNYDAVVILNVQAEQEYDLVRKNLEVPTTRETGTTQGDYVAGILHFTDLLRNYPQKDDPKRQVNYYTEAEPTSGTRIMDAAEALDIARTRLVPLFWYGKTNEYIKGAQDLLKVRKPEAAAAELQRCDDLPGRGDGRLGVIFPPEFIYKIQKQEEQIAPELKLYRQASDELARATRELSGDLAQANKYFSQARNTYPYHPDLESVRGKLIEEARSRIQTGITTVKTNLKERSHWPVVGVNLKMIAAMMELDSVLGREFQTSLGDLQALYARIDVLIVSGGKSRLSRNDQLEYLDGLRKDFSEEVTIPSTGEIRPAYWNLPGWKTLQTDLERLEAGANTDNLEQRARLACHNDASQMELNGWLQQTQAWLQSPPAAAGASDIERVKNIATQLSAWLSYIRVRDERKRMDAGEGGDLRMMQEHIAQAEKILAVGTTIDLNHGMLAAALEASKKVISKIQSDDGSALEQLQVERLKLHKSNLVELREVIKKCVFWLTKTTSYRTEWLQLKIETQGQLLQLLEQEVAQRLKASEADDYANLDISELEKMQKEARSYADSADALSWLDKTELPLLMARAQQAERNARTLRAGWGQAHQCWELALKKIDVESPLMARCRYHERDTYKKEQFELALQQDTLEQKESILLRLYKAPSYRTDVAVQRRYSENQLQRTAAAWKALLTTGNLEDIDTVYGLTQRTREGLNRSAEISDSVDMKERLSELERYERLVLATKALNKDLKSGVRLSNESCRRLINTYQQHRKLNAKDAMAIEQLTALWDKCQQSARTLLESQLQTTTDRFDKLDGFIALSILSPDDMGIRGKLNSVLLDARNGISEQYQSVYDDVTATRFAARKPVEASQDKKDVTVQRQINDCTELIQRVQQLELAYKVVESVGQADDQGRWLVDVTDVDYNLSQHAANLGEWKGELQEFQVCVDIAKARAQIGLSNPNKLDDARYILRDNVSRPAAELPRVPQKFHNLGHPVFEQIKKFVETCHKLYMNQLQRSKEIELALKFENALQPSDIVLSKEMETSDVNQRAWINSFLILLSGQLQLKHNRQYPIEIALERMKDMQREAEELQQELRQFSPDVPEDKDPCRLQLRMTYIDPDEPSKVYRGLSVIQPIIARKARQTRILRTWLDGYLPGMLVAKPTFPGVVDWDKVRPEIEVLRDSGPNGLVEALKLSHKVLKDGYKGLWSLTCMKDELSREAMQTHLSIALASLDGANQDDLKLCAPAQTIDQERSKLQETYAIKIENCNRFIENIVWRVKTRESAWGLFESAYLGMINVRLGWFWNRKPATATTEWEDLQQAVCVYRRVCPKQPEFLNMLEEVIRSKHLPEISCNKD